MMKASLAALIRLATWRCEDGRRAVSAAAIDLEALHDRRRRLAETLVRERLAARELPWDGVVHDIAAYERRVAAEHGRIADDLASAEATLAAARDGLANAFAERRRFELAEAGRRHAELRERERRERAALDELALHGHGRIRQIFGN
ncbi:MAG: hypothetical protein JNM75_14170 [Rhodospirillales bacterium]|nr:hypothetical protein [Rhodospirillales bacterium]